MIPNRVTINFKYLSYASADLTVRDLSEESPKGDGGREDGEVHEKEGGQALQVEAVPQVRQVPPALPLEVPQESLERPPRLEESRVLRLTLLLAEGPVEDVLAVAAAVAAAPVLAVRPLHVDVLRRVNPDVRVPLAGREDGAVEEEDVEGS